MDSAFAGMTVTEITATSLPCHPRAGGDPCVSIILNLIMGPALVGMTELGLKQSIAFLAFQIYIKHIRKNVIPPFSAESV